MTTITTYQEADALIFASYNSRAGTLRGYDQHTRDITSTRGLLTQRSLLTDAAPTLTITGSKGKGSTAIWAASVLQAMGYRVGLLTSPHFFTLRERIRVQGQAINEVDFIRITHTLAADINAIHHALPDDKYLSPTGIMLAIALHHFKEQAVDYQVLEVGRGGRYDEVSLVHNAVSAFTPIMGEHLDKLGPTIGDVAWHKAGIIKPYSAAFTQPQTDEVIQQLQTISQQQNASLHIVTHDKFFSIDYANLRVPEYQQQNLTLAYAAACHLASQTPAATALHAILPTVQLIGRCDTVHNTPRVIVDGAINGESAQVFRQAVFDDSPSPRILVTALPADKDYRGLLDALAPDITTCIVTRTNAHHLTFNDAVVVDYAKDKIPNVMHQPDVNAAFAHAEQLAGTSGTLWAVGTQSFVADALRYWQRDVERIIG